MASLLEIEGIVLVRWWAYAVQPIMMGRRMLPATGSRRI